MNDCCQGPDAKASAKCEIKGELFLHADYNREEKKNAGKYSVEGGFRVAKPNLGV